jgi:hypothetical protein
METMLKSALDRWSTLQSTGVAKFTDARCLALKKVQEISEQVQKEGLINGTAKIASEAVKPQVEFARQTYVSVHDAVAVSPAPHLSDASSKHYLLLKLRCGSCTYKGQLKVKRGAGSASWSGTFAM